MGLTQCAHCHEWIAEGSATCPQCGAALTSGVPETKPRDRRADSLVGILVLLPLLILGGVSFPVTMSIVFAIMVLLPFVLPAVLWHEHHRHHPRH